MRHCRGRYLSGPCLAPALFPAILLTLFALIIQLMSSLYRIWKRGRVTGKGEKDRESLREEGGAISDLWLVWHLALLPLRLLVSLLNRLHASLLSIVLQRVASDHMIYLSYTSHC